MEALPGSWDKLDDISLPQAARDVIGHADVFNRLIATHRAGRLHHGIILSGPRGIGKATFAYRFAAWLLSNPQGSSASDDENATDGSIASRIAACAHPNVLTASRPYDAKTGKFATRITVDSVREVTKFLRSTSGEANWRIVVVDSADDMNASSANALLKILEEPPPRTLIFLLAHSPRGLLPTLRSRCQVFMMKALTDDDVSLVLDQLGIETGIMRDQAVAMAGGSVRRALAIMQSQVSDIARDFIQACRDGEHAAVQVHAIAGQLAAANKSADYALFIELMLEHVTDATRTAALASAGRAQLAAWDDAFQRIQQDHAQATTWNLDKKQVVLNAFHTIRQCHGLSVTAEG